MMIRYAVATIILTSSVLAQDRVGTSPQFGFLGFPPSVRAAGMGMAGVASADGDAGFYNPALPVMGDYEYFSFSFSPSAAEIYGMDELQYRTEYVSVRLPLWKQSPFSVAFGHGRVGLKIGPLYELTYNNAIVDADDPGLYFEDQVRTWSASVAWDGPVKLAIGAGYWRLNSHFFSTDLEGKAGELGLAIKAPLTLTAHRPEERSEPRISGDLTFGLSFQNYGPDIKYQFGRPGDTIEMEIPLPKTGRWGLGLEIAYGPSCHDWLSFAPIFQKEIPYSSERKPSYQIGLEIGLAEILYLRWGRVDRPNDGDGFAEDHNTRGIGLSTTGIRKLSGGDDCSGTAKSGLVRYLLRNLNVEFSFARIDMFEDFFDHTDYYSLQVTL